MDSMAGQGDSQAVYPADSAAARAIISPTLRERKGTVKHSNVCSLRITVRYHTDNNHPVPDYFAKGTVSKPPPQCARDCRAWPSIGPSPTLCSRPSRRLPWKSEEEYVRLSKSSSSALTEEDRERFQALASDLPRLWNDRTIRTLRPEIANGC